MIDYQGEKFRNFLKRRGISVLEASKKLGVNRQTVYNYFKSKNLSREVVNSILTNFDSSEEEIFAGNPRLEAVPLHLASDPNDIDNDGSKFERLVDGVIRMRVPIIPVKAYAGYLRGFKDPEFYEGLPTISIDVYQEHRGTYMAFEVEGDSMTTTDANQFEYMALPGWKAIGREVLKHHWQYKLHTHKTDTWIIVHRTEGILIKNITHHDVQNARITVHSLNPKYKDETFSLNDIDQIFSVVKYVIDK